MSTTTIEKTSQKEANPVKFSNSVNREFAVLLNKRVNSYFKSLKSGRYANTEMVIKTIFMLSLYFVPYAFIVSGSFSQTWLLFLLAMVQGFGMAGIGLSIMHDANHGAYSRNPLVNRILGYTLNVVGGSASNWKIQHNVMHHTYTNIAGHDEDISPRPILRFSPHSKLLKMHKYQYIYAWFLYGLMTITWISFKDFKQLGDYTKSGILEKRENLVVAWSVLILTKIVYFGYALVIPMIFAPFAWWVILLAFIFTHYVAGFLLGIIFQPAHVMEENEFPLPSEEGVIGENWLVHQLKTTMNFASKSRIFSWYVGGLNFQVEHHLFPNVCHVHYRNISKIVRQTAKEFDLPYKSLDTFREALVLHGRMLYKLGRA